MNKRYREFLDAAPDPWEARRGLIDYARVHGAEAAARMSGAGLCTVYRLVRQADTGTLRLRRPGRPSLTPEDEAEIVAARLAHPEAGALRLKRDHGLRYGHSQIKRVLREHGLARKRWRRVLKLDPEHRLVVSKRRLVAARLELTVAEIARAHGFSGFVADVERIRRRLEKAERKVRYWTEKARVAQRQWLPSTNDTSEGGSGGAASVAAETFAVP